MEKKEVKVIELFEIDYFDLLLVSSSSSSSEIEKRIERIRRSIMESLGPKGPGLLSITGVPNSSLLRRLLLLLSPKLSLLHHDARKLLLKEHNLGSDVSLKNPDRNVSSFAMQLKYSDALPTNSPPTHLDDSTEFQNLSHVFKELGYCMMDLGLRIARICDHFIGDQELEHSLLESGTAKARLIHYHSPLDALLLKQNATRKGPSSNKHSNSIMDHTQLRGSNLVTANGNEIESRVDHTDLWQQWHYDYGIFTVLTAPMFLMPSNLSENMLPDQFSISCHQECPYPNGYSYLQIYDPNNNSILMVKTSPDGFIIQVGESADILSKGKLRSTLHSVSRPVNLENVSRETFVVFLQPAWNKTFSISDYSMEPSKSLSGYLSNEQSSNVSHNSDESTQDFDTIIPPLSSRLKDGMTFAEFSRETTKQYYGGRGLQANR